MKFLITEKQLKLIEGLQDRLKSRAPEQEKESIKFYSDKILNGEYDGDIPDNIFAKLSDEIKEKFIEIVIKRGLTLYLKNNIRGMSFLSDNEFNSVSDVLKLKYIKMIIDYRLLLSDEEFNYAPNILKLKYINMVIDNDLGLSGNQFDFAPDILKLRYIDMKIKNGWILDNLSNKQKNWYKEKNNITVNETIRKKDNKYCLYSKKGRNLGCYPNKSGAEKREKQVQYFKHLNEYQLSPGEQIEWDLENNTTKITRLDGSIEWILQNEDKTLPYLQKLFKSLNKGEIVDFGKRLLNKVSSGGNKRKLIMVGLITAMINYGISKDDILHQFSDKDVTEFLEKDLNIKPTKEFRGNIEDFLNLLAFKESSGNWKKIRYSKKTGNPVYIGKYQFGRIALEDLGINPEIINQFENNPNVFPPKMQDKLVKRLLKRNKSYLGDNYLSYDGKVVGGVEVTTSGLLASSHLRGALAVKKFLDSNGKIDLSDANGTKVSDYMKYFAGFDI